MLSPAGRCKTLDSSADGYVRAEAVGCLLLADLNSIMAPNAQASAVAVVAGSAVNQVGQASAVAVVAGSAVNQVGQAYMVMLW